MIVVFLLLFFFLSFFSFSFFFLATANVEKDRSGVVAMRLNVLHL